VSTLRSGSFRVPLPPSEALELFTARGESLWVPGWKPRFVDPPDGEPVPGGVWLTDDGDVEVIWRVERFDRAAGTAEYLRVVPGNRVALVSVRCSAEGGGTRVEVAYRVTPIAPAGEAWLAAFDEDEYAEMMREWERLVAVHLAADQG
jgi:hypothetical protein